MTIPIEPAAGLTRIAASDVKRRGWRSVLDRVRAEGAAVVTNHDRPEAVVLSIDAYGRLLQAQQAVEGRLEAGLDALRRQFDDRLAALRQPSAGTRLRAAMGKPARLRGRVKAGSGY